MNKLLKSSHWLSPKTKTKKVEHFNYISFLKRTVTKSEKHFLYFNLWMIKFLFNNTIKFFSEIN